MSSVWFPGKAQRAELSVSTDLAQRLCHLRVKTFTQVWFCHDKNYNVAEAATSEC